MPYICLARGDIPDGTVQVSDLQPNASQALPTGPQPQARYVNRPRTTPPVVETSGQLNQPYVDGLGAFLLDRVEPGGLEVASATLTMAGPLHGDTVTVAGVPFTAIANFATGTAQVVTVAAGTTLTVDATVFTCVEANAVGTATVIAGLAAGDKFTIKGVDFTAVTGAPANPALQQFEDIAQSGSAILSATSLVSAINDVASQALITAAAPAGVVCAAANVGGTSAIVTITASAPGNQGEFSLVQTGNHITLSGANMVATDANAAAGEFNSTAHMGTDILAAGSLAAAINASVVPVSAANAGSDTVTITADARGLVGELALVASVPGELVLSGIAMAAVAPVAANQEFSALAQALGQVNTGVASSFRSALVDGASIAAMKLATGAGYVTAAAPGPGSATLTLTAVDAAGAAQIGPDGNFGYTVSNSTRLVQDTTAAATLVLNRTHQKWLPTTVTNTAAALLARVDAGSAMALANVDAVLLAQAGAELTALGGSNSTGTVADLLAVLAGRGYRVAKTNPQTGAALQYMQTGAPSYLWEPTQLGGFTVLHRENGAQWGHGEIRPNAIGGDWVSREVSPIRHTVNTDTLKISLASGQLAVFCAGAGMPPVTLWPDSDVLPHYPWTFQGTLQYPEVLNARVLTVYDDDGSVLA